MEGQEKQALVMTTVFSKQLFSLQPVPARKYLRHCFLKAQSFVKQLLVGILFMISI